MQDTNGVPTISTGQPSTLGTYKGIATVFGPKAVAFIAAEIAKHDKGADEEVIADERQMLMLFASMVQPILPDEGME